MTATTLPARAPERLEPSPSRPAGAALVVVFTAASFASAFLLFLVQPMVAKLVLPAYGGAPSVWNAAMVFFQGALLLGYFYAHGLTRRLKPRRQLVVHLSAVVLAALALPIALPEWAPPSEHGSPALRLVLVLLVTVGAPFVALSTTGPLLQRWFSRTTHRLADDPYFLYAASNAGSFLALLGYPVLFEPLLRLDDQTRLWAWGYGGFVVLVASAAVLGRRHDRGAAGDVDTEGHAPIARRRWLRWVGLAFIPSSLMLGVTSHITTDVAAVPLLWVLPLAAYLATFVVAFGRSGAADERRSVAAVIGCAVAVTATVGRDVDAPLVLLVLTQLVLFVAVAYVAHRRLALDRPEPGALTSFYLALAVGGVLGGIANALVAPLVFNRVLEYPIVLAVALVVLAGPVPRSRLMARYGVLARVLDPLVAVPAVLVLILLPFDRVAVGGWLYLPVLAFVAARLATRWRAVLAIGVAVVLVVATVRPEPSLASSRTFFGVYRVYETAGQRVLEHGSTIHGREWLDASRRDEPLGYYGRTSPIGHVFEALGPQLHQVSVVGLGVGTLAAYGDPARHFTFYEIDPEVEQLATRWFSYLGDTRSPYDVVIGDGRLELEHAPAGTDDLLVLDAFSSDAIPVHLMTREAVELYVSRLARGGVLAFHVSNNHLDLVPVLAGIAHDLGLAGAVQTDLAGDPANGIVPSQWVVLAPDKSSLQPILAATPWQDLASSRRETWTDDSSNLLSVLR